MRYNYLGKTDIKVSQLGFGSLTIGPLQANLSLAEGAGVVRRAFELGVNFIDTAELYDTYSYIKAILPDYPKAVISSKSYAYSYDDMKESVACAIEECGRGYIDIFSLHEQTSRLTLKGHSEAIRYLCEAKKAGLIRAVGVSTHTVEVVRAAAMYDEIDIIHPIINQDGIGIIDGSTKDMLAAIDFAAYMGKGIYAMKALAGGHLSHNSKNAIDWIKNIPAISSTVIGMQSLSEVEVNAAYFEDRLPDEAHTAKVSNKLRSIHVENYCMGCGACKEACPFGHIEIVDGKCRIDTEKCMRCAYCAAKCPQFCIKVF